MPKLDRIDPNSLQNNPRASLIAWKRYEEIVLAAFAMHPHVYTYRPQNLAPSTVCSRLRDAIRGAIAFSYPSKIPHEDLVRWYSEVVVKNTAEHVIIGPQAAVLMELRGSREPRLNLAFRELSFEEVVAFTILLSAGRISGPITIHQPPDISLLPERVNVEVMQRLDGSLVLL